MEYVSLLMFVVVCFVLLLGYPVALSLAGTALIFAGVGSFFDVFDLTFLGAFPSRIFGTINNQTLLGTFICIYGGNVRTF